MSQIAATEQSGRNSFLSDLGSTLVGGVSRYIDLELQEATLRREPVQTTIEATRADQTRRVDGTTNSQSLLDSMTQSKQQMIGAGLVIAGLLVALVVVKK